MQDKFMQQCIKEYQQMHPEVYSTWMHLYGDKWMRTYDLQIRIIKFPGDLPKLMKP